MSVKKSAVLALALTLPAVAAEKKISRSQLPPAVEKTVQEQSKGATIKGFSTDNEGGVLEYEAELIVNGHTKDVSIDKNGTVLEVEEEVAMSTLPEAVQNAVTAKAAGARITNVEALTKKGKLVAYEAATVKGTKHAEIQVGPNGETLTKEE